MAKKAYRWLIRGVESRLCTFDDFILFGVASEALHGPRPNVVYIGSAGNRRIMNFLRFVSLADAR